MNCTVPARPAVGRTLPGTVVQQHELYSRSNRLHSAREPPAWSSATQTGRTYVRKISSVTVAIIISFGYWSRRLTMTVAQLTF